MLSEYFSVRVRRNYTRPLPHEGLKTHCLKRQILDRLSHDIRGLLDAQGNHLVSRWLLTVGQT
jgi:hypothetical protein